MNVLILRHGPAGDKGACQRRGLSDDERPLTPGGRRKTGKAADGLARLLESVDVIACSPLLRARQTADILARRFKNARRVVWAQLKPDAGCDTVIAALLGCRGLKLELKKAGSCLLSLDKPRRGAAKLVWLLQPKQLRALR